MAFLSGRRAVLLGAGALALGALGSGSAPAQAPPSEYEVKAAFLFNFTGFIDWPQPAFRRADEPFVVGVLGDDPFGDVLERTFADATVAGHPVAIRRWASVADMQRAHILFVSGSEDPDMSRIDRAVRGHGTLTVADTGPLPRRQAAIICFRLDRSRVRFDVNLNRATQEGFRISSQLLKLARIVDPSNEG